MRYGRVISKRSFKIALLSISAVLAIFSIATNAYAGIEGEMKSAVEGMHTDVYKNGWMAITKIAIAVVATVMTVAKQQVMPFGIGVAGFLGIHFFQKYTEAAVAFVM